MTSVNDPALPATATDVPLPKEVLGKPLSKEIASERRIVLKNIGKAATSMVAVGCSLKRVSEKLQPFGSKMFSAYLNSVGISRSHSYQLIKLSERFAGVPSSIGERFCGTSMLLLANRGNDEAVTEALHRAEDGQRVSVATAKEIIAKHKPSSERKAPAAIKFDAGQATLVLHPRASADVSALAAAIEQVIEQYLAQTDEGRS